MASLNRVMLIGRLGRDPELRYTQGGQPVANFSMATDESYTGKDGQKVEQTEWHKVVVFGRQAETVSNYLGKGSLVYVEGSLQTRKWQDQQGNDRWSTEVKGQRVQFLETRGAGQGAQQGQQGGYQNRPQQGGYQNQGYDQDQNYPQGQQGGPGPDEDMGSPFPSEASGMDDVPF